VLVYTKQVFGLIRSLAVFRLTGSNIDLLVVGSDSGKILFLEFKNDEFLKVHLETYGRSGCRRIIPG